MKNKIIFAAAFISIALLSGCATTANYEEILDTWVGSHVDDLVVSWGPPQGTFDLSDGGKVNYVGVAQRGRVQERLEEHLPGGKDYVPGAKVQIEQVGGVAEARKMEAAAIKRIQPKHNKQGK